MAGRFKTVATVVSLFGAGSIAGGAVASGPLHNRLHTPEHEVVTNAKDIADKCVETAVHDHPIDLQISGDVTAADVAKINEARTAASSQAVECFTTFVTNAVSGEIQQVQVSVNGSFQLNATHKG